MRRIAGWLMAVLLCVLSLTGALGQEAAEAPEEQAVFRALLVGCDHFLSQVDTGTAATHNVQIVGDALLRDGRYALIRSCAGGVSSPDRLAESIWETFEDAKEQDTSLLYISTHGQFEGEEASNASAALILSDGAEENKLYAAQLEEMLNRVPGNKILILDACNSGAFIGKGLSGGADRVCFLGPKYHVLCSAGGSEASWYFQGAKDVSSAGASYFATVLADGLGRGADANQDGTVTLNEIYAHLLENYAASTPQMYPQNDGVFPFFQYSDAEETERQKAVTGLTFEDTLLTAGQSRVAFSFTVHREVELYYQVIYHENGVWQFEQAQHFQDGEGDGGTVLPGRKARTLKLDTGLEDAFGYVMIQLFTLEEGRPVFQGARLLCVQPGEGEAQLHVAVDPAFLPDIGQELCILAQHDVPCALSVSILNQEGRVVRRLAYDVPSRPQQLTPNASSFYWDGRIQTGEAAPAGFYTVQVRVRLGEKVFLSESAPVELIRRAGEEETLVPPAE